MSRKAAAGPQTATHPMAAIASRTQANPFKEADEQDEQK
jgi:hypothetical protein